LKALLLTRPVHPPPITSPESSQIVTGPSLTSSTSIIAPNRPVAVAIPGGAVAGDPAVDRLEGDAALPVGGVGDRRAALLRGRGVAPDLAVDRGRAAARQQGDIVLGTTRNRIFEDAFALGGGKMRVIHCGSPFADLDVNAIRQANRRRNGYPFQGSSRTCCDRPGI
jgi:hypothetical protein